MYPSLYKLSALIDGAELYSSIREADQAEELHRILYIRKQNVSRRNKHINYYTFCNYSSVYITIISSEVSTHFHELLGWLEYHLRADASYIRAYLAIGIY